MTDITAVGEILIDLTQSGVNELGVPEFAANPGGAPANLAVAAARLGAKTAFIGKVGADSFGTLLRNTLTENTVDVSGLCVDTNNPTTLAVVSLDSTGERSFSFYRNPSADVNLQIEDIRLVSTKFLHFGSVSLTTEPARSATLYAVKTAKEQGAVISYDPNYRPSLWESEATAIAQMRAPLSMVDVLKVSDEELLLLTGTTDLEAGSKQLADMGISLILITLGADGAFYRFQGHTGHISGVKVAVGDTNGAGDTFLGATLAQLAKFQRLKDVTIDQLEAIIAISNKAAAITTSRHGAIPAMPTYEEVFS
ncbi:MAG: carbohydrate kinase [Oscillospiraceae bacterium]|nr:carbohydrate kinase [Oscillospiraceae bacterium]